MALPKIFKNIDARVKDTGDTMTGSLNISSGALDVNGAITAVNGNVNISGNNDRVYLSHKNVTSDNACYLQLSGTDILSDSLKICSKNGNTTSKQYNIYGEHNKDIIPFLPIEGGILTGETLGLNNGSTQIEGGSYYSLLGHFEKNDTGDYRYIGVFSQDCNNAPLERAVQFAEKKDGKQINYVLYGEHNINIAPFLKNSGGTLTGLLTIDTNNVSTVIGAQNQSYTHYITNANNGHYFNKATYVHGNIYAGSSYSDLVLTLKNYPTYKHYSYTTTASPRGYFKVHINSHNNCMFVFTIRLYQSYKWSDIVISGYNYGGNHWYSPSAILMGSSTEDANTVYFGYDKDYYLWVAFPGTNYTGFEIIDVANGYQAFETEMDLFTVTHEASLTGTIQSTVIITRPWYRTETLVAPAGTDYGTNRIRNTSAGTSGSPVNNGDMFVKY